MLRFAHYVIHAKWLGVSVIFDTKVGLTCMWCWLRPSQSAKLSVEEKIMILVAGATGFMVGA